MVHETGLHFHVCASQHLYFKLELQEGQFIELLAVQHKELINEDLMELEAQRKDKEKQEEEVMEEPDSGCRKWRGNSLRRHCSFLRHGT